MRTQMVMVVRCPPSRWPRSRRCPAETKVESAPTSKSQATTDRTVQQKTERSSTTVVEHTTIHPAKQKPTQKTHSKQTVERSPTGSVSKSETVNESK